MKNGHDLYYNAAKMLFKVGGNQMGKFYNLPISGESGGTLTWRPDVQNGAESLAYLLASTTGGQNMIGGLGTMHNANGMSSEQIIMQSGLAEMAEYMAKGIDTSDYKFGMDSIKSVGPGGCFLTEDLTMDLLRGDEFFYSHFLDMTGGYADSAPGMHEIAHQKVKDIVNNYKPTVPGKVQDAIQKFFKTKYTNI